jgi:hypothetical protein
MLRLLGDDVGFGSLQLAWGYAKRLLGICKDKIRCLLYIVSEASVRLGTKDLTHHLHRLPTNSHIEQPLHPLVSYMQ